MARFTFLLFVKCFSGSSILNIYSKNKTTIDRANFKDICPAIVQQLDSKACNDDENHKKIVEKRESKGKGAFKC